MVGLGLGYGISFSMRACNYFSATCQYLGCSMSAGDVIAHVALAAFALVTWRYVLASVKVSLSDPSGFKMLG